MLKSIGRTSSPGSINIELISLLEEVSDRSMIGLCIQMALESEQYEELVNTLRDMATDNPKAISSIIGVKAFMLLQL
jgi:hypothetical protein